MTSHSTVLITGASTGIGAIYADRFARRGHDLVLVARDKARLETLAARLREETGSAVDILAADLTQPGDLAAVETRLREDARIETLINNAGAALSGPFIDQSTDDVARLVSLNTTALVRLASAIAPRLVQAGKGAIVNIGSVVGLAPEFGMSVYGATKAFVLFLSQGLSLELTPKGIYVQAVLPAGTRTEIWERAGIDTRAMPDLMGVEELVDAALAGFDRRELVTIPPLHDAARWETLNTARQALVADIRQAHVAERYRTAAGYEKNSRTEGTAHDIPGTARQQDRRHHFNQPGRLQGQGPDAGRCHRRGRVLDGELQGRDGAQWPVTGHSPVSADSGHRLCRRRRGIDLSRHRSRRPCAGQRLGTEPDAPRRLCAEGAGEW
ncbi:short-subunit dehydrogenase [Variovorax boronicumulans]|nr:short-subunit dehydrogenase [Variovorax boronicumulans]